MIPRYSRPEMVAIWSPRDEVPHLVRDRGACHDGARRTRRRCRARPRRAIWEKGARRHVRRRAHRRHRARGEARRHRLPHAPRRDRRPGGALRAPGHDVVRRARHLLSTCSSCAPPTSSSRDIDALLAALKRRAFEHKYTPTIGRSHGIHAEPTTFGLKLAEAYAEFERCKIRLIEAQREISTCAISGAVGTFANIDPRVEEYVAEKMGLAVEPVSTQVIPRDRHAMFFATLAVIASSIERLATEIRHLQRTEVLEAEEFFSEGQKGSSAMPHKRNPVLSENLTGLARMVRAYARAGARERRPLARARHLAFVGRAHDRPRRDRHPRLRPRPAHRRDRQARGLSGDHAPQPRPPRRPRAFAARACWR